MPEVDDALKVVFGAVIVVCCVVHIYRYPIATQEYITVTAVKVTYNK